jgi:hypothetical protein
MMTKNVLTVVAAAAFAVFTQGAFAQASSPSRADVKAETKAAEKSGKLTPAGEGPGAMTSGTAGPSDKTREQRKAQTKADAKAHNLTAAGEGPGAATSGGTRGDKTSSTTREERKAQTKADAKAGKLQPAGESAGPVGDAPKK